MTIWNRGDIYVAIHWDWGTYLPYFAHQEMMTLSSMPGIPDREQVLVNLQTIIEERQQAGQRVFNG